VQKIDIDITPDELHSIVKEYEYDPDIMNNEDERSLAIKKAMTKLPEADKIIWALYMELQSSRKLGVLLGGVSHSTILKEISRIREAIIKDLRKVGYQLEP
jgi:DNA-directed RNA polymerase specialized sigma subunit